MKRLLTFLIFIIYLAAGNVSYAYAQGIGPEVAVNVNGQRIYPDVPAFIKNERTLVPLRGIFEKLGASVEWVDEEKKVIVNYKDKSIILQIDNKEAEVNGLTSQMDVAPIIYNDRTMIPLRFISENIGMQVGWVPESYLATITDPTYLDNLPDKNVLGFTTNDFAGDTRSHSSLVENVNNITSIATFSYQVNENGGLNMTGYSQKNTVKVANSNNIKPLLLIHNFRNHQFDKELSHAILTDESKRRALINNLLVIMSKEEYSGVNIDIENVYWYDRQYYSTLIRELKETLAPYGFLTTVSIPAKTNDSYRGNNWGGAFDYREIGKYADLVLLMTYDEHFGGGSVGPIASYPWVENVIRYATSTMPSKKILLGIAGYGYDWSDSGSKVLMYRNADKFISSVFAEAGWDEQMKSPYFKYRKDGIDHEVWYEDSRSISSKLAIVNSYNLGGIGIWRLGFDDSSFWNVIKSGLN